MRGKLQLGQRVAGSENQQRYLHCPLDGSVQPAIHATYTFYTTTMMASVYGSTASLLIDQWVDQAPLNGAGPSASSGNNAKYPDGLL